MGKTIIISNRLPVQLQISNGTITAIPSVGGLATGMKSVHSSGDSLWIGWSGLTEEDIVPELEPKIDEALAAHGSSKVKLTEKEVDGFYYGFSNRTIWPLFHYFLEYSEFQLDYWNTYKKVNQKFADAILAKAEDGDTIWVHDYQLMLVPQMVRKERPNVSIGFFLHIPFPSFEIFRTLPWREELLEGVLGSDLIGFHTYDYERHFLSSVRRLLGLEVSFNDISMGDRLIKVDSFPMGIDYKKFSDAAKIHYNRAEDEQSELQQRLNAHKKTDPEAKFFLSIDRLDYSKGIAKRLNAFEYFLNKYPQYKEKVRLIILAVPSRSNVPQYQLLKREIDELVGRINGEFSTVSWTPIWYFYRSMPFENLIDLYTSSDIAWLTPLRDGMNLVAKEYIATRTDKTGVLILSEMAGSANEMNESLLVNPNNFEQTADALHEAINMPVEEQKARNSILQKRLARYNVEKWANDFMTSLKSQKERDAANVSRKLTDKLLESISVQYSKAKKRLLFLDYDGTLAGFHNDPQKAGPDEQLYELLDILNEQPNTVLYLISGRDKDTFTQWFLPKKYNMIVEHGVWISQEGEPFRMLENVKNDWMEKVRPVLESFVDRTPGSFIEEKNYSLAWHYRKTDPDFGSKRAMELSTTLTSLIGTDDLSLLNGNKVVEVKSSNVNKGRASVRILGEDEYDFVFAIGDDWTDEFMFQELPESTVTVKVGIQKTAAKYYVESTQKVRGLLQKFAEL
ncbi:bifunctional alpha,alpha-trehalose-phosphate synthase (UDP-forming)/trehalose-phosphatase [Zobellia galactanivorans]|uniref:Trehalose-6-phosphate synthase/phosphatase, family GT20 n=1 Tax=Zobellia galactanivorans (strain DSM 12802 / CCUG 47099 / CIP 106680 / NCIMB 13871 / Dsij) TaxID=63186 RepID=G0L077_ZOBGA|nr:MULTISPECIES: bifunctional alpha,alpha-trehalose-phosphate synthase (UDP-forming)/trehalose-phosphatase [Zobellia]MBU3027201.1 bifunctional alpha,alpha-trehalose-phosphate synthase (UDP-forming)/trehalose-phosphatase [Zobellia galactanivorans]MDO6807868.1 bifunctional alpha,alpha-trehalose-phosphate synthase (UDP-forming)/trehalose-phosphatase [Zobellia galactanivorans]OWW24776.1 bifunctional alpha,alpha-trehalose-phosphate synthase (UDP-forming)/trehalose-phosphatase [Zobellia sp. OII3]CAZ9